MKPIYGIDLGTTYTKCALARSLDQVEIFKLDRDPSSSVPLNTLSILRSAVAVSTTPEGKRCAHVGLASSKLVEDWFEGDPEIRRFEEAKVWIGEKVQEEVGEPPPWYFAPHAWSYRPEDIGAIVLRKVKQEVENARAPTLERVVITHPQYFTDTRRQATIQAAQIAGFEVVETLTEPDAAAVAYGVDATPGKYMVFDLGGGTLDVTIAEIGGRRLEVVASDGLKVGGRDFDRVILQRMIREYQALYPDAFDPSFLDRKTKQLWMQYAERVKIELNQPNRDQSIVKYECSNPKVDFEGQEKRLRILRAEFLEDAQALVDSCIECARSALGRARVGWDDIAEIICVGGSTRLLGVRAALEQASGKKLKSNVDPDAAIAHGAALHGFRIEHRASVSVAMAGREEPKESAIAVDLEMLGVLARGLGIRAYDPTHGGDVIRNLVPKGQKLPWTGSQTFKTRPAHEGPLEVHLYEGEELEPDLCVMIGRVVFTDLPAGSAKQPVAVTIKIDANGTKHLIVSAFGLQREQVIEFDPSCVLPTDDLDKRRAFVAALVIF